MFWSVGDDKGIDGVGSKGQLRVYDDVIKWKHFPRYWPFVRGIHRWPVNSPHKGQWRGALMFSLIYACIKDWVNNREAGDFRRHRAHYDVILMSYCVCYSRGKGRLGSKGAYDIPAALLMTITLWMGRVERHIPVYGCMDDVGAKGTYHILAGLILGLRPANERRQYKVTPSLIG